MWVYFFFVNPYNALVGHPVSFCLIFEWFTSEVRKKRVYISLETPKELSAVQSSGEVQCQSRNHRIFSID